MTQEKGSPTEKRKWTSQVSITKRTRSKSRCKGMGLDTHILALLFLLKRRRKTWKVI